jgi:hypothetical protein
MNTKKSLLDLIDNASGNAMVNNLTGDTAAFGQADPYDRPTRKLIASHSDDDLHELIAARPTTREAEIARSIMRGREAWRTPARWSLAISAAALALSLAAFVRTL